VKLQLRQGDDMRRMMALGLIATLIVTAMPSAALAGAQSPGTVTGVAHGKQMQSLTSVRVQIRTTGSGQIVGTTTTAEGGTFSFSGLPSGDYVAEVVDAAGKVQGVSSPFVVTPGGAATTSVVALSYGASAAATGGGFSLFGMGPVTSMTVLGAAAAASVAAVVSTRPDASPSR
jgi:hypothetical protein